MSLRYGEPSAQAKFRDVTAGHRKMAGCTLPSFRCRTCKCVRPVKGRKLLQSGDYECAECAPRPVAGPVAASRPIAVPVPPRPSQSAPKARETLLTDDQVRECRAAYEFAGAKPAVLARYYQVTPRYMRTMLDYVVRSKLIPASPNPVQLEALRSLFCDPGAAWRNER